MTELNIQEKGNMLYGHGRSTSFFATPMQMHLQGTFRYSLLVVVRSKLTVKVNMLSHYEESVVEVNVYSSQLV